MHLSVGWLSSCLLVLLVLVVPANGQDLECEFAKIAEKALEQMRSNGIQSTGVLKFAVRVGGGEFPPNLGRLNLRLAEKMEVALALANPTRKSQIDQQVGIVRNASKIADSIDGANHLSEEGRRLLFSKPYPLAWVFKDQSEVVPDSLVVGAAQISDDLTTMDLELMLVKKEGFTLTPLGSISVATDLEDLVDAGESYSTRGIGVREAKVKPASFSSVVKQASNIRHETEENSTPQSTSLHPLGPDSDAPIRFEVLYDGVIQPFEFRNGGAFIKEPHEGQRVTFTVHRKNNDDRLGVLVRVNGANTLYRRTRPDSRASLWTFKQGAPIFRIKGFYIDKSTIQEFKVLSDPASKNQAVNYGQDAGIIAIAVYTQEAEETDYVEVAKSDSDVMSQAKLPETTLASRGELGSSLFAQLSSQNASRGLIAKGESKKINKMGTKKFKRSRYPIMATSIRYYGDEK